MKIVLIETFATVTDRHNMIYQFGWSPTVTTHRFTIQVQIPQPFPFVIIAPLVAATSTLFMLGIA